MAKKISQLTQATQVKSDDVTVIVQDGETKKLPLNTLVTKQDIENKKVAGLAKLDEIEATYENDTYTPTITVKNKSSVKTGEGDEVDYSANVMDGHVKSAILKGNTLINSLITTSLSLSTNGNIFSSAIELPVKQILKPNTRYLLKYNVITNTMTSGYLALMNDEINNFSKTVVTVLPNELGKKSKIITTKDVLPVEYNHRYYIHNTGLTNGETVEINNMMLIEYQEGMENWDIPYFEDMQSVKMPVLTTTGKNLFDASKWINGRPAPYSGSSINQIEKIQNSATPIIECKPNTTYTISRILPDNSTTNWYALYGYNKDGLKVQDIVDTKHVGKWTFTTNNDVYYLRGKSDNPYEIGKNELWQIEEGSTATPYEPFKSNILTVNEEVTLRGIGDVKDTLDCLTGEVVSNFETLIIDGTENWYKSSNETELTVRYRCDNIGVSILKNNIYICDSYNVGGNTVGDNLVVDFGGTMVTYRVLKSKFPTLEDFKKWLNDNPHTFIYQTEKSIKTVDLMPSGTHPSTTPYCWKNGHIQLSSSGLLPNLEYSVVTSRAGQINQNATMIVKNDKRIFDLEILLAGGLVNTTYQALTLQNQVETGLSKASLNSETEPDYLLYHMIMKLIEEKAYKLDDLTEKVSVFYLYEKLSDEQFETIYSALYPFVEDEIVEEPVVEELPEVVEDEVIM